MIMISHSRIIYIYDDFDNYYPENDNDRYMNNNNYNNTDNELYDSYDYENTFNIVT